MSLCFFVSDLHGHIQRYRILFERILQEKPAAVFFGGDLLPSGVVPHQVGKKPIQNFVLEFLIPELKVIKAAMGASYPRIFLILGNDDGKGPERYIFQGETLRLWEYIHNRQITWGSFSVFGYAYIPPTPFQLKDWERYDISRYVDPGCIPPEAGWHTFPTPHNKIQFATIQEDLQNLRCEANISKAIFLFHAPPYQTHLDRAALDGHFIDHVPLDVHVGSIAIRKWIESHQPLLTLHGHIHESTRLTGRWMDQLDGTFSFSAAHDGPELALVRFDPQRLENARRELISLANPE